MGKHKKKNGRNQQPTLSKALLVKAILDILIALMHIIDKMKE